jgi:excisionase family DNA binding protein
MVSRRDQASKSSYLLPSEVAEVLQVSPKTVTRWAKEGKLASRRTLGGHRRYARAISSPWRSASRSRSPPESP